MKWSSGSAARCLKSGDAETAPPSIKNAVSSTNGIPRRPSMRHEDLLPGFFARFSYQGRGSPREQMMDFGETDRINHKWG